MIKPHMDCIYYEVKSVTIELADPDKRWLTIHFTDQTGLSHELTLWPSENQELGMSFEIDGTVIAYTPEMFSKPESHELKGPDAPQPGPQEDPLD